MIAIPFITISVHTAALLTAVLFLSPKSAAIRKKPILLLLNAFPILYLNAITLAAFNTLWLAPALTSALILTLTIVNRFKVLVRDEPFLPSDFILIREAARFSDAAGGQAGAAVILPVLVMTALTGGAVFIPFSGLTPDVRVYTALAAAMAFLLLDVTVYSSAKLYGLFSSRGGASTLAKRFEVCGFLYSFWFHLHRLGIEKPDGFSPERAREIITCVPPCRIKPVRPHVVFVMAESFSLLSDNPFFIFDRDPLEHFREVPGFSGKLVVPNYGGGTSNTEFDVLTGLYTMYINPSPFSFRYVRADHPSVAAVFKENGYTACAIHPGLPWVYNRKNIYPRLGFDTFLSEKDFPKGQAERKGGLVSDRSSFQKLRELLEKPKSAPSFTYLLTIQNHTPYDNKFEHGASLFRQAEPFLSPAEVDIISNYFIGAADAARELKALCGFLNAREEPYLLVFYGDHLPSFGPAMRIYDKLGFDRGLRKVESDYLIWQNDASKPLFNLGHAMAEAGVRQGDALSAHYLGALALELLGLDGNQPFYRYLNTLRRSAPVLSVYAPPTDENAAYGYRIVQYSRLTGQ